MAGLTAAIFIILTAALGGSLVLLSRVRKERDEREAAADPTVLPFDRDQHGQLARGVRLDQLQFRLAVGEVALQLRLVLG